MVMVSDDGGMVVLLQEIGKGQGEFPNNKREGGRNPQLSFPISMQITGT
jgi:hypothetical protein